MPEEIQEYHAQKKANITPRELIMKYIRFVPWVVLSVLVMLSLAYIKLRYSTPIYRVNAKLQVKNNNNNSGAGEKFDEIFMMQGASRNTLNDEIDVIKSRMMAKRVINKLNLQYKYTNKGKFRSSAIHITDMPFFAEVSGVDSADYAALPIVIVNETGFTVGENPAVHAFGEWIDYANAKWRLTRTERSFNGFSKEFVISWIPIESLAAALGSTLDVIRMDNFSNIFTLGYETSNATIGADILNQYMKEYQQFSLEDKQEIAKNTILFIDDQLDTVKKDLGSIERLLQTFREQNRIVSPEEQSALYLNNITENSKQLMDQSIKMKVVEQLQKYINDQKNPFRIVPTSLGIAEPSLLQQIGEYNRMLMERETMLVSTPAANPVVVTLEAGITKLRGDMLDNLRNIRQTYSTGIANLEASSRKSERDVGTLPGIQKRLLEISRQQKILEELYSYLLQKKLETSIGSASTISSIRVIEPAFYSGTPISPNRKNGYLMALFIGLLIPVAIIVLKEYLNDKVQNKRDVEKITDVPILGEIGHSDSKETLITGKHNRKVVAEQFRMIRTNLQYILHNKKKNVILITSSFSGEGKSFMSTNIAGVIALTGKRTVILEFDIRKPKIVQGLGLKRSNGISNYVVGGCMLEDLVVPVPGVENLFVVPCGPVPPNPAELLLDPKIGQIFDYVTREFEVVIIDTAPVGLVSDAITLGKYADATVYVVRHNYTRKRQIQLVDDLYVQKKMPGLSVVINDINLKTGYGGYYGYGGYGYGYGYGFGKGSNNREAIAYYGQEERRPTLLGRIRNFFRK